jgi:hypothetical protein
MMFDSIIMRRLESSKGPFDVGQLAELLLFYGKAHLHLEDGGLIHLIRELGLDQFQTLIDDGYVEVTYFDHGLGTQSTNTAPFIYNYCAYSFAGTNKNKIFKNKEEKIRNLFERTLGKSAETKKAATKFLASVSEGDYIAGYEHNEGIPGLATEDLQDSTYTHQAIGSKLYTKTGLVF